MPENKPRSEAPIPTSPAPKEHRISLNEADASQLLLNEVVAANKLGASSDYIRALKRIAVVFAARLQTDANDFVRKSGLADYDL